MEDITRASADDFESWLQKMAGEPSEEQLAEILSNAMRTDDKREKAQLYVQLANAAMSLADTTLGFQGSVQTSVQLRH